MNQTTSLFKIQKTNVLLSYVLFLRTFISIQSLAQSVPDLPTEFTEKVDRPVKQEKKVVLA